MNHLRQNSIMIDRFIRKVSTRPLVRMTYSFFISRSKTQFKRNDSSSIKFWVHNPSQSWFIGDSAPPSPRLHKWHNCTNQWLQRWQWCWRHRYVGDFMIVTDFRCWWQNHYVGDFFHYVRDFINVLNQSPTFWIGHQHLKLLTNTFGLKHTSPTSM